MLPCTLASHSALLLAAEISMVNVTPRLALITNSVTAVTAKSAERIKQFYYTSRTALRQARTWYKTAIDGLPFNTLGLLCYPLGWISGIILLFSKKEDSFVRFHAWQSIVTFGILTVPIVVLNLLPPTHDVVYLVLMILYWIVIAFTIFLWILLMLKAYQGQVYSLPLVDGIISQLSNIDGRKSPPAKVMVSVEQTRDHATMVAAPKPEPEAPQDIARLRGVLTEAVRSIVTLCETRDPYTASHQHRVAQLACAIAREMGFSEDQIEGIRIIGVIHDIGKVAVPTEILSKPGKISNHEFSIIKTHPQVAHDILKGLEFPWPVAQAILQHHEKLDGSGYPNGLSGENIILEARILAVSDVVEAMASHRPYRPALGIDAALKEIAQKKVTLYDAIAVEACLKLFHQKRFKLNDDDGKDKTTK